MPDSAAPRVLPERRNPLLGSPPSHQELVDGRYLGQTKLQENDPSAEHFSYVHLRVTLPNPLEDQELFGRKPPVSYFLMRRSKDGFVSCTGMFKVSFPWARKSEEALERQYIKTHYKSTSNEETAGNLWVDPTDALTIAEEYGIRAWIQALIDNQPVRVAKESKKRDITPPPAYFSAGGAGETPETASPPRRRSTRSMSPSKQRAIITPRKARATKAGLSKVSPLKKTKAIAEEVEETETTTAIATEQTTLSSTAAVNGDIPAGHSPSKKRTSNVKIEVDEQVEKNGDVEVETTHVKVELPHTLAGEPPSAEGTKAMIEQARQMVAEVKQEDNSEAALKRKAEDDDEEQEVDAREIKRAKAVQVQLRKEKVKTRALIGLSATLALGALLPYFM